MLRAQEVSMKLDTIQIVAATLLMIAACGPRQTDAPVEQQAAPAAATAVPEHTDHPPAVADAPIVELPAVPPEAKVTFVSPADGASIEGPLENGKLAVWVNMGVQGIALKPAGPVEAGSGHHHILIDAEAIAAGGVVPKDEQHLHFGKGQSEATLSLTPGPHKLSLQFADGIHRSYGPQLAASINITTVPAGSVPPPEKGAAVKP
jgi:hypothetical protein